MEQREYVLGQSAGAARRLEIQDATFAEVSEQLLDDLALWPGDRVVEFGCGPGSFSRRLSTTASASVSRAYRSSFVGRLLIAAAPLRTWRWAYTGEPGTYGR